MTKRRTFDHEFKQQAIQLPLISEFTQTWVSEELGFSQNLVSLETSSDFGVSTARTMAMRIYEVVEKAENQKIHQ